MNSWTWILYIICLRTHPTKRLWSVNHKLYNPNSDLPCFVLHSTWVCSPPQPPFPRLILSFLYLLGIGYKRNWESARVKSRLTWKQIWPITICFTWILPPCKRPLKGTQSADVHAHCIPILSCFAHHKMRVKQKVRSASGISKQTLWSWTNCKSKS